MFYDAWLRQFVHNVPIYKPFTVSLLLNVYGQYDKDAGSMDTLVNRAHA